MKWLFRSAHRSSVGLPAFFLYILDKSLLLVICAANFFAHSVASLLSFLMVLVLLFCFITMVLNFNAVKLVNYFLYEKSQEDHLRHFLLEVLFSYLPGRGLSSWNWFLCIVGGRGQVSLLFFFWLIPKFLKNIFGKMFYQLIC